MTATTTWLRTTAAAAVLGVSPDTLKRLRRETDLFEGGKHYRVGASINSPIVWNAEEAALALHQRGMELRAAGCQAIPSR